MKLYHYDHCPYCVKARMIFGLKQVPFELVALANDDEETPVGLVGAKLVPILERDGVAMGESLDIVRLVDALDGTPALVGKSSSKLAEWVQQSRDYIYPLAMPRWIQVNLEEFQTQSSIDYFVKKKEAMMGSFDNFYSKSDSYIAQANAHLKQLAALIHSKESVNTDLSEDDLHVFAALRSLSVVKGIKYPALCESYRQAMAVRSGVALHDAIAI